MKTKMKLYVWTGFCSDYSSGLAFAIARTESEARKLVSDKMGFAPYDWGTLTILPVTRKTAFAVCGGG